MVGHNTGPVLQTRIGPVGDTVPVGLSPANERRRYLRIENVGSQAAVIAFGIQPDARVGIPIAAGASREWTAGNFCPVSQVTALCTAAGLSTDFVVIEG